MKHQAKLFAACLAGPLLAGCASHTAAMDDTVERDVMSARLDGGSYKALQISDPVYHQVVNFATGAAYEAAPTRANVEATSVMQAATGDYFVNFTMTGMDHDGKQRLVVVSKGDDDEFKSQGVILY